jgi:hypothetical protein
LLQNEEARILSSCRIKDADYERAAGLLGVEVAAVKAVLEVETGNKGGFLSPGHPTILFEGHIFWNQLKERGIDPTKYQNGNEDILYPKWNKSHYKGGLKNMTVWKKPALSIVKPPILLQAGVWHKLWDSITRLAAARM